MNRREFLLASTSLAVAPLIPMPSPAAEQIAEPQRLGLCFLDAEVTWLNRMQAEPILDLQKMAQQVNKEVLAQRGLKLAFRTSEATFDVMMDCLNARTSSLPFRDLACTNEFLRSRGLPEFDAFNAFNRRLPEAAVSVRLVAFGGDVHSTSGFVICLCGLLNVFPFTERSGLDWREYEHSTPIADLKYLYNDFCGLREDLQAESVGDGPIHFYMNPDTFHALRNNLCETDLLGRRKVGVGSVNSLTGINRLLQDVGLPTIITPEWHERPETQKALVGSVWDKDGEVCCGSKSWMVTDNFFVNALQKESEFSRWMA